MFENSTVCHAYGFVVTVCVHRWRLPFGVGVVGVVFSAMIDSGNTLSGFVFAGYQVFLWRV
jgi:hypothetical protein